LFPPIPAVRSRGPSFSRPDGYGTPPLHSPSRDGGGSNNSPLAAAAAAAAGESLASGGGGDDALEVAKREDSETYAKRTISEIETCLGFRFGGGGGSGGSGGGGADGSPGGNGISTAAAAGGGITAAAEAVAAAAAVAHTHAPAGGLMRRALSSAAPAQAGGGAAAAAAHVPDGNNDSGNDMDEIAVRGFGLRVLRLHCAKHNNSNLTHTLVCLVTLHTQDLSSQVEAALAQGLSFKARFLVGNGDEPAGGDNNGDGEADGNSGPEDGAQFDGAPFADAGGLQQQQQQQQHQQQQQQAPAGAGKAKPKPALGAGLCLAVGSQLDAGEWTSRGAFVKRDKAAARAEAPSALQQIRPDDLVKVRGGGAFCYLFYCLVCVVVLIG
jgi:hypothetical protein